MLAPVGGRVDLQPVTEPEKSLGSRPMPNERVEGREQRSTIHSAAGPSVLVQVGLLFPAANADGADGPVLDQLLDRQADVCGGDSIVVAQVVGGRDTERLRRSR